MKGPTSLSGSSPRPFRRSAARRLRHVAQDLRRVRQTDAGEKAGLQSPPPTHSGPTRSWNAAPR
jgi:hypothetical protein